MNDREVDLYSECWHRGLDFDYERWYRELRKKYLSAKAIYDERIDALHGHRHEKPVDRRFKNLKDHLAKIKRMLETALSPDRAEINWIADNIVIYDEFDECSNRLNVLFREYHGC